MKISRFILFTFFFILLLFSITTYYNFRLSEGVAENEDYLSRSTEIIKDGGRFQRNILTMVNGLRGYLLTGERSFIESYDSANIENDSILQELGSLLTDSSQSHLLLEIKQLNDKWTDEFTDPLKKAKTLSSVSRENLDSFNIIYKSKFATGREKEIQTALKEKFREFTTFEYGIRRTKGANLSAYVKSTRKLSLTLILLSVLSALLAIGFLILKISNRIRPMTKMANDIGAGNYDVSIKDQGNDELSPLVHSLNHMAAELSRNISLLKSTNEELDQFAHLVSHDLKSPLRGIGNVVSWIEEDHKSELNSKLQEYIEIIKGRIVRAENLIEGLLSYARADKEELEKEWLKTNELVDEVIGNLSETENAIITVSPLPVLYTEKILLFQIFSNLIGNAMKYNDKKVPEVSITYKEHPTAYEFFIADNGIGIAPVYHKRIFTIFQTLGEKEGLESTGVGLAIVKKILDSKNQRISLESTPGKGSIFSFTWSKN